MRRSAGIIGTPASVAANRDTAYVPDWILRSKSTPGTGLCTSTRGQLILVMPFHEESDRSPVCRSFSTQSARYSVLNRLVDRGRAVTVVNFYCWAPYVFKFLRILNHFEALEVSQRGTVRCGMFWHAHLRISCQRMWLIRMLISQQ